MALEAGPDGTKLDGIELDVQRSLNGVLVVHHDFHLPDVPFHLSAEGQDFGVGYLVPYGVEAHVRLRILEFIGLTLQALVLQRPGGEVVVYADLIATLGVRSGKPPGPRTLLPGFLDPTR